jgi:putative addiction module component (TIGR02574 family)
MSIDISVDAMTTSEKLALMERLWEALSQRPANVPSPEWHGAVLAERIAAVREGRSKFIDWDEAKERLRSSRRHRSASRTDGPRDGCHDRPHAAGEPEARERHCDGEVADRSKITQGFAGTPLQDQPTTYGAEAAGDVLHRRIDRHEATAPSGLNAGRDQ